jgi:CspA family cold shock protein
MNAITITGTVKWFDTAKGFGFVVPDNGLPDALLHHTVVRGAGFKIAFKGARVTCRVTQVNRQLRVLGVLGTAAGANLLPRSPAYSESDFAPATVKSFDDQRGFGFLTDPAGDIFLHVEVVKAARLWPIAPGEQFRVRICRRRGRRFAIELWPATQAFAQHGALGVAA